ncbi:MAG: polysaccharide deacetylase family protein [Candidatus Helarchaeota archaeon]
MEKKKYIKKIIIHSKILRMINCFNRSRIAILKYHSVKENPDNFKDSIGKGIIHSTEIFIKQMKLISRNYNVISMNDVLRFFKGKISLPKRAVVVTFDDGYHDNYEIVAPILDLFGIKATFYITVDSIGNNCVPWFIRLRKAFWSTKEEFWFDPVKKIKLRIRDDFERINAFRSALHICTRLTGTQQIEMVNEIEKELKVETFLPQKPLMMNWDQIIELRKKGHIIGSHTLSHSNSALITEQEFEYEARESKRRLESKLHEEVIHFSYPNPSLQPHWNENTIEKIKKIGYQTAVTSNIGSVDKKKNIMAIPRMWVPNDIEEFIWYLDLLLLGKSI